MPEPFDVTAVLRDMVANQPLVRKYSNTVTSAGGLLVGVVWLLISNGIDVPSEITTGTLLAIAALTTLGIRITPNGITERQIEEIQDHVDRRGNE